jgi:hypothetical protein
MKKARTLRALSGRNIKREEVVERSKPYAARTSGTLSKASEIELDKREQSCSFVVTRTQFKERRISTVLLVHGRNRYG